MCAWPFAWMERLWRRVSSPPETGTPVEKPAGPDWAGQRQAMVLKQIKARGLRDPAVLAAMAKVPRHVFVPERLRAHAYRDGPLPIGEDQTISQPYVVAYMAQALQLAGDGSETVLEIGTGCGYAAAVVAEIAGRVYSIERIVSLAERAAATLAALGYSQIEVRQGDGTLGWPEAAPFDAIVVTAAGPSVPDTLKAQLKIGGRLVMPVENSGWGQSLVRLTRLGEADFRREELTEVRFVPLIGAEGWPPPGKAL